MTVTVIGESGGRKSAVVDVSPVEREALAVRANGRGQRRDINSAVLPAGIDRFGQTVAGDQEAAARRRRETCRSGCRPARA